MYFMIASRKEGDIIGQNDIWDIIWKSDIWDIIRQNYQIEL